MVRIIRKCRDCGAVHPEDQAANPDYCIAELGVKVERLEEENARLRAELEVRKGGVNHERP